MKAPVQMRPARGVAYYRHELAPAGVFAVKANGELVSNPLELVELVELERRRKDRRRA